MKLEAYKERLNEQWKKTGLAVAPHTSVVSPLYPGNFCYCLDEIEIYRKYGNFIEIGEEHYQKMQPAIRIADFHRLGNTPLDHLGQFSLATIGGFNSVPAANGRKQYELSVENMFGFMNSLGLDLSRFQVSFFSGNEAKLIEASRKPDEEKRKIRFDKYIAEDELKQVLISCGLKEYQLVPNNTRDNYLTSAWYVTEAPWGYRNEILYRLPNGRMLDVGTIERLVAKPTIEKEHFIDKPGYEHIATGLSDWHMNIIVDGIGIERILQAIEGKDTIFDIEPYSPYRCLNHSPQIIEAGKIAHRVFSDTSLQEVGGSRNHRRHIIKQVMRTLNSLNELELRRLLQTNAEVYAPLYPELSEGIKRTLEEIIAYRERCE